jgi:Tfp pilus assembly protein PilF
MRINLAGLLAHAERFAEAEEHYRKAIEMEPGNAALHNNLGVTLFKQGSLDAAIAEFRQALAIAPNLRDAQEGLEAAEREVARKRAGASP